MAWEEAEDALIKLSNRPFWLVCFVFPFGPFWSSIRPYNSVRCVYVVVQFYPWFKFYFLLFSDMVMYDNEFETIENKI